MDEITPPRKVHSCTYCGRQIIVARDGSYWVHATDTKIYCSITSFNKAEPHTNPEE